MKKINLKLKDISKLEFELLEDANKGDFFSLNDYQNIDFSSLNELISKNRDKVIENKIEKAALNAVNEFKISNEYKELEKIKHELDIIKTNHEKELNNQKLNLEQIISNKLKLEYEKKILNLENEKNEVLNSKQNLNKLLENERKHYQEILNQKDLEFEEQKKLQKDLTEKEINLNYQKKISELESKNSEYLNNYQNLNQKIESEKQHYENLLKQKTLEFEEQKKLALKNINLEIENKFKDKISSLESKNNESSIRQKNLEEELKYKTSSLNEKIEEQKKLFEEEKKLLGDKLKLELENNYTKKFYELEHKKDLELQYLKNEKQREIEEIKRQKSISSKLIGEDLEQWILNQYQDYLGSLEDSTFIKANEIIDGTKPDFIFTTYDKKDNSRLVSVTIEAKSQAFYSNTTKKNSDFFAKLDSDRIKNNSEFSLLISELENEKSFSILKIIEYENMYVVRPWFFIPFLALVRSVGLKRKEINNSILRFKEKQEIFDKFQIEKNEILNNSIKHLQKNLEDIDKNANSIIVNANKILESKRIAYDSHVRTIINKIENFSITKESTLKKILDINEYENNIENKSKINLEIKK